MEVLKQAAIEEGQWREKRDLAGGIGIALITERLNAGRQRVADAKKIGTRRRLRLWKLRPK